MDPKKLGMVAVAVVAIVVAITLVVRQAGPDPSQQDPMARWVCDNCGEEATLPLENKSPDCQKCDTGQLVQRRYQRFRHVAPAVIPEITPRVRLHQPASPPE